MFRGIHSLNLDAKGRLAIPGRYRDDLTKRSDGQMVVTVNNTQEHCLWLYPLDSWRGVQQKVMRLPDFDPNHQKLKRFFIGYASDLEMDKSGRVLLPAPLREFAAMKREICLIGQGNKFELWSAELWNARRDQWLQENMDMEKISVEMEQLSL